ncbi:unnamed protein product, partial [Iphiclides podalirius]
MPDFPDCYPFMHRQKLPRIATTNSDTQIMVFNKEESTWVPEEYERWENDGVKWVIQDLPPEDEEKAIQLLVDHLGLDEVLCSSCGLNSDPESVEGISKFWRHCLSRRTSLACYAEKDGARTLVGANVCVVLRKGEHLSVEIEGKEWQNVYHGLEFVETKRDPFEYLGLDVLLCAYGLVVKREYRGARLGARLLNARQPLSKRLGVKATTTVFTGISSQKLAAKCGFTTIAEASLSEMAASGLDYPKDDQRVIKLMVKRFD